MERVRFHRGTAFICSAACAIAVGASVASATPPAGTGHQYTLPEGSGYVLFVPSTFQPSANVDLLVHFHGDPATYWANEKYANQNALVVTVNLGGLSSAYQTPFASDTTLFGDILTDALATAKTQGAIPSNANWRKVGVTSFSAGYGAVREILKQPSYYSRIDCMMLADTIYASFTSDTDHTPLDSQMVNWRKYALDAKNGLKTMIVSHTQVPTYTYSNTIETADDLMASTNTSASPYNLTGLGGVHFYRYMDSGNLTVYGALGSDATAHSLMLQNMGQWMDELPIATLPEPGMWVILAMAGSMGMIKRHRPAKAF
jgi:hypothetical protein